jgi:hypothetical protein
LCIIAYLYSLKEFKFTSNFATFLFLNGRWLGIFHQKALKLAGCESWRAQIAGQSSAHTLHFICTSDTGLKMGFLGKHYNLWWLRVGSNHRPQHYECRALTN